MKRTAIIDGNYRYSLKREWDESKGKVVFILLNPSLANGEEDDQTTKRCIYFAKKFGYGSLEMVNLFAYITPHYKDLKDLDKYEAIGDENYNYIVRALNSAKKVIAAWGENGTIHQRYREMEEIIDGYDIDCLGTLTRDGHPRHPLFLSNDVELIPYKRPKNKVRKLIRTAPISDIGKKGREGVLIKDGEKIYDDSWMWCKLCHEDFPITGIQLCESCFDEQVEGYKQFLIEQYSLGENSANQYVGRFKGIINKGLYNGDKTVTPNLIETIEKAFPNSKNHYVLTIERYIEYQNK